MWWILVAVPVREVMQTILWVPLEVMRETRGGAARSRKAVAGQVMTRMGCAASVGVEGCAPLLCRGGCGVVWCVVLKAEGRQRFFK